jgi:hypothetical protein
MKVRIPSVAVEPEQPLEGIPGSLVNIDTDVGELEGAVRHGVTGLLGENPDQELDDGELEFAGELENRVRRRRHVRRLGRRRRGWWP